MDSKFLTYHHLHFRTLLRVNLSEFQQVVTTENYRVVRLLCVCVCDPTLSRYDVQTQGDSSDILY